MSLQVSTRFKELILGTNSFADIFDGGIIQLYSGPQPASADMPATGTLLGVVTNLGQSWSPGGSAGGLLFSQDGMWARNHPSQNWMMTVTTTGTVGWFRLAGKLADTNGLSYSAPRMDGRVGAGTGVEMHLPSTALTVGQTLPIQQFYFSFPPLIGALPL